MAEKKRYLCPSCDMSYKGLFLLKMHMVRHLPLDHPERLAKIIHCPHDGCIYSTDRVYNLKLHTTALHTDKRPFNCDECEKTFRHPSSLRSHKTTVHAYVAPCSRKRINYAFCNTTVPVSEPSRLESPPPSSPRNTTSPLSHDYPAEESAEEPAEECDIGADLNTTPNTTPSTIPPQVTPGLIGNFFTPAITLPPVNEGANLLSEPISTFPSDFWDTINTSRPAWQGTIYPSSSSTDIPREIFPTTAPPIWPSAPQINSEDENYHNSNRQIHFSGSTVPGETNPPASGEIAHEQVAQMLSWVNDIAPVPFGYMVPENNMGAMAPMDFDQTFMGLPHAFDGSMPTADLTPMLASTPNNIDLYDANNIYAANLPTHSSVFADEQTEPARHTPFSFLYAPIPQAQVDHIDGDHQYSDIYNDADGDVL